VHPPLTLGLHQLATLNERTETARGKKKNSCRKKRVRTPQRVAQRKSQKRPRRLDADHSLNSPAKATEKRQPNKRRKETVTKKRKKIKTPSAISGKIKGAISSQDTQERVERGEKTDRKEKGTVGKEGKRKSEKTTKQLGEKREERLGVKKIRIEWSTQPSLERKIDHVLRED